MDSGNDPTATDEPSAPAGAPPAPSGSTKRPIKSLSSQEWETYRDVIKELYNRMPLKEVIDYMSSQYNFFATARMYKTRLNQWGLNKYVKHRDMQTLVERLKSSKGPNVPVELEIDGKAVPRTKVERFAKRKGQVLDKDGPATTTTPLNSNSPTRSDSIGADYILIDSAGKDIELGPDDASPPAAASFTSGPLPLSHVGQQFLVSKILPASPSGTVPGLFTESPEPDLIGNPVPRRRKSLRPRQQDHPDRLCPSAPRLKARILPNPMEPDTIQLALLLTLLLSAMIRQRPLGDLEDVRIDALEQQATVDMSVFTIIVDLLGWLQLDRHIVLLAAIYIVRFDSSPTFPKSHNVWQQLLVALRFAQIYLDDEPYSRHNWFRAIPSVANSSIGQRMLELDVLGDEHIRLRVDQNQWRLLETRLSHISTSLLVSFEKGIFTFETRQRAGSPMELTSSVFL
jgi:hypothetical protein